MTSDQTAAYCLHLTQLQRGLVLCGACSMLTVNCSCSSKGALAAIEDPGPLEEAITHGDLSTAKKLLQTAKSETESNTASESKNKSGEQTKLNYCT